MPTVGKKRTGDGNEHGVKLAGREASRASPLAGKGKKNQAGQLAFYGKKKKCAMWKTEEQEN